MPLVNAGRWEDAVGFAQTAYDCQPDSSLICHVLGVCALNAADPRRAPLAVSMLRRAADANPDDIGRAVDAARAYCWAGENDLADAACRRVIEHPDFRLAVPARIWRLLSGALYRLGRSDEARACEAKVLAEPSDGTHRDSFAGEILIDRGDFKQGWALVQPYLDQMREQTYPSGLPPRWDGQQPGRVLFVAEQGYGDVLQMARYLPEIARRSGQAVSVLLHDAALAPFLSACPSVGTVVIVSEKDNPDVPLCSEGLGWSPEWTVWSMEAPRLLETTVETIPPPSPPPHLAWRDHETHDHRATATSGLTGPARLRRRTAERAANSAHCLLRVGICWAGAADLFNVCDRNVAEPDATLAPLWQIAGVEWVNLQQDLDPPKGAPFARRVFLDFAETAAVLQTLDACVTVDTSVAHLAGTLGVPTLMMAQSWPGWRWATDSAGRARWYPSVRVIPKRSMTDWPAVLDAVSGAIHNAVASLHLHGGGARRGFPP